MAKSKYSCYVVWAGRKPGIYTTWDETNAQVKGFAGAQYKGFVTRQEAETAYARPAPYGHNASAPKTAADIQADTAPSAEVIALVGPCLVVDASCVGNPGPMEYRVVLLPENQIIYNSPKYALGTNNIGEFLAIVQALRHCQQHGLALPIYSDSITGLAWLRKKTCASELSKSPATAALWETISAAEQWLAANPYKNPVHKWNTDEWGEIPADYGRK
jgi:ribonuclease HI